MPPINLPEFTSSSPTVERGLNRMAREVERLSADPIVSGANVFVNGSGTYIQPLQSDQPILTLNNSGSTWVKGTSVTANVYQLAGGGASVGEESDSGVQLQDVYVRLGDVPPGKWAYLRYIGNYLEVWAAEC